MADGSAGEQKTACVSPRYEFYQSDTHLTIVVWLGAIQESELQLSIANDHFLFIVERADSKYQLEFDLAHPVGDNAVTKIGAKKVEIKVPKRDCITWTKLEKVTGVVEPQQIAAAPTVTTDTRNSAAETAAKAGPPGYPSSSKKAAKWDDLERQLKADEAEEKPQDEAALNALFQKIYADADDDTKRAMVKSFVESNGTVLSTDWNKVGQKEVKTKPPSGMEFKQWQL